MAITKAYFDQHPVFIPQAKQNNGINADVYAAKTAKLDSAIRRHEKAYLTRLLGRGLYAEYISTPTDAKWDGLNALLYDATLFVSPIANYIYYWFLDENAGDYDGSLVTTTKQENATNHPVLYKQIKAWNAMVEMNVPILSYLQNTVISTTAVIDKQGWGELYTFKNSMGI